MSRAPTIADIKDNQHAYLVINEHSTMTDCVILRRVLRAAHVAKTLLQRIKSFNM